MSEAEPTSDVAALTVQLLSAYLTNNTVPSEDLAALIRSTREALTQRTDTLEREETATFTPAVSVRKSLASPDHIISLIDGKPYKTLKRHLAGHGLTPEAYRNRYNLPANYPMVAPGYAEHRRNIAKEAGLGTKRSAIEEAQTSKTEKLSGASIEDAGTIEPQPAPEGMAEAKPSVTTNKNKAGARSKPSATAEAKLHQVPPASQAVSEESSDAADKQDLPTTVTKPKRRGKLGLFGEEGTKPGELTDGSAAQSGGNSSAAQEPASGDGSGSAKTPAKRKSLKRMARTPKISSDSQGNEASNEDEAAG